jgi:site-specific DNA recombinase
MTHVVYARRSSDSEDRQVLSIESQLKELRQLAADRGLRISGELIEKGSAREPGRPVFNDLMKRVRSGVVDGILVWKIDRLARNMVDGGEVIYYLTEGTLKEIVTSEGTYTGTPDTKFMLAMLFGAAAKVTDDLSAAVKRGNRTVLEKGKVPGPVPLGYMKTHVHEHTPGSGTVIPDPERFDLVRRLWKEVLASGDSVAAVWREARDWGITTRPTAHGLSHPVSLTNVYAMLRNPFYAGRIVRGGRAYDGEHAPMVTLEEFERVQALLDKHGAPRPTKAHAPLLYRGLLHCGHCSRVLTGEVHPKGRRTYIYYRCGRRHTGHFQCHAHAITEKRVTGDILAALERVTIDPVYQHWAINAIEWWAGKDEMTPVGMTKKAERALAKAERELSTLTDLVVDDNLSKEEYSVLRANQLKRIEHLHEALSEPLERLEAWRAAKDEVAETGLNLAKVFRLGMDDEKRELLVRTCSDVVVMDKKARLVLRIPFMQRGVRNDD